MTLADRIVVMHDGRIEQIGTPMELFLHPANTFVAGFLGSPPMNQVQAVLEKGEKGPVASIEGQKLQLAPIKELQNAVGREVIVGIRPEYVETATAKNKNQVKIDVDLIETLGSEALIHANLNDKPFVIRTETLGKVDALDAVTGFKIDPKLVCVFDAKSGRAFEGQG